MFQEATGAANSCHVIETLASYRSPSSTKLVVHMRSFFLTSIAIATTVVLSACGGSDGVDFAYPGAEGATLAYTQLAKLSNGTEVRNGGFGSAMAKHPTLPGHFYALTDRGPNAATAAG
ncbi:MAG: hypothetical protein U1E02_38065, partial [Hydrogenophaga sp.]|nr:hypothetical protein [Hydrogenophaga sp.]